MISGAVGVLCDQPCVPDQAPGLAAASPRRFSSALQVGVLIGPADLLAALVAGLAGDHDLAGDVLGAAGGVVAAEAVGEDVGQAELLLRDEALVACRVLEHQVHHRA